MNDSKIKGVPYLGSIPGSPAEKAGLLKGDEILSVNGKPVATLAQAADALAQRCNPMVVDLIRGGRYMEIRVALAEVPAPAANPATVIFQLQEAGIFPKTEETKESPDNSGDN